MLSVQGNSRCKHISGCSQPSLFLYKINVIGLIGRLFVLFKAQSSQSYSHYCLKAITECLLSLYHCTEYL